MQSVIKIARTFRKRVKLFDTIIFSPPFAFSYDLPPSPEKPLGQAAKCQFDLPARFA